MQSNPQEYYKDAIFDLGDVKHGQTPSFKFIKTGGGLSIESVNPGCGSCTHPRLQPNGDILGHMTITNAIGRNVGGDNELRHGDFVKTMRVYLKDGNTTTIENSKGNNIINPEKSFLILTIKGNVIK